ncbi:hypothetical protein CsSME_00054032 [Camellia sinensis var. sinensis]
MADDNVEAFLKINGSLVPQRYAAMVMCAKASFLMDVW